VLVVKNVMNLKLITFDMANLKYVIVTLNLLRLMVF